ncbi:type II toxin-antitoxin system Phd/YefM family antitoxin [Adlercreutzia sp. ZJ242]|uniref:type II toxin-antitoxin system Phd/YefM family antitoxin n=1 Tax=Adlercreutzia sp. ZJ242 TaxID=2709409 RepID=UPI0013EBC5E3|nr:type II toxin-antitoxin system Phd/YefM family antitoxin [Adlercreutzia sp. ZJ242]
MGQADVLDRLVPITSFNKGHASRIFERARSAGPLFVLKNNAPEAVIVSPEEFARMSEAEENYALLLEAAERLEANAGRPGTPMADVMEELGITEAELDAAEDVELA